MRNDKADVSEVDLGEAGRAGDQLAPVLTASGLSIAFGGVQAVEDLSLTVFPGRVTGLVGPNGAGKSTVLNLLSGFYTGACQELLVRNLHGVVRDVRILDVQQRAAAGLGRTFQTPRLFAGLSLIENILVGQSGGFELTGFRGLLPTSGVRRNWASRIEGALEVLSWVGLEKKGAEFPSGLSLGEQRLVEIARALGGESSVLLLDEPFAGLARSERQELTDALREILTRGTGVLLVEHNLEAVRELATELIVMREGRELTRGTPNAALEEPSVVETFLGAKQLTVGASQSPAAQVGLAAAHVITLELADLTGYYGPIAAVRKVSVEVGSGECLGVIGANGAGKSTLLRAISGQIRATGNVTLGTVALQRTGPAVRRRSGIALVPQEKAVIAGLTVFENLHLSWLVGKQENEFESVLQKAVALFPALTHRMSEPSGNLSGGQRQMLAVARGLMSEPQVLLLDEPTAGLAPIIIQELSEALHELSTQGLTMVLVEQNLSVATGLSDNIIVLSGGEVSWRGAASALDRETVTALYLGRGDELT